MLKRILELDGAQELSKDQQQSVNGGKKCRVLETTNTLQSNGATLTTCAIQCRPTFLGIGVGSWSEIEVVPC